MKLNTYQIATYIGVILLVISVIWWQQTSGMSLDNVKCLAFSGEDCRISAVGKTVFGGAGYNPIMFWIGVVCLVLGYVLKRLKNT